MSDWIRPRVNGIELKVRLTPRSSSDQVEAPITGADGASYLAARVRALPEKGKANSALEDLIAKWAGTPKSSVSVTGGSTSRVKTVFISGDPVSLEKRLIDLTHKR